MQNFKTELVQESKRTHVSTTCNKCGTEKFPVQVDHFIWETFAYPFFLTFKEGSIHERKKWGFDLCEDCVLELVRSFKVMPDWFAFGANADAEFEKWKYAETK